MKMPFIKASLWAQVLRSGFGTELYAVLQSCLPEALLAERRSERLPLRCVDGSGSGGEVTLHLGDTLPLVALSVACGWATGLAPKSEATRGTTRWGHGPRRGASTPSRRWRCAAATRSRASWGERPRWPRGSGGLKSGP